MAPLSVLPVRDSGELRRFLDVPHALYRDDARWVPPFRSDELARARLRRNPFWKRASGGLFLARRGSEHVGRISVHADLLDPGARPLFGWFDAADEEVSEALVETARRFARDEGLGALVGPASFTALDVPGALVEGHDVAASHLAPWHPPATAGVLDDVAIRCDADALCRWVPLPAGAPDGPSGDAAGLRALGRALRERAGEAGVAYAGHPGAWAPTAREVASRFARLRPAADHRVGAASPAGVAMGVRDMADVLRRVRDERGLGATARVLREARRGGEVICLGLVAGSDVGRLLPEVAARAAGGGYTWLEVAASEGSALDVAADELGGRVVRRYATYRVDL